MITITVDATVKTTYTLLKDEDYLINNLKYIQNNNPSEIRLGQNIFDADNKGVRLDGFQEKTFKSASSVYISAYYKNREIEVY